MVLPGSPNRGMFGGDGAYGESKSALDAVVDRWNAESSWAQRVSLAHALIGWTKGTGLMGHNDAIVGAVEEAGVTTYTTGEMAAMLLDLCTVESKVAAAHDAAEGRPDRRPRRHRARHGRAGRQGPRGDGGRGRRRPTTRRPTGTIAALPSPPRGYTASRRRRRGPTSTSTRPTWWSSSAVPNSGPYGSSRTRFEMEVDNELSAAGVLELAWTTGLIKWEDDPKPGWYDTADR